MANYIDSYMKYKIMYSVDATGEFTGKCALYKNFHLFKSFFIRFWLSIEPEICEDLLSCNNLWQNNKGQGSQVCGHVVCYRRNYGTTHWVLNYQWSGNCLLWNQNHPQNTWKASNKAKIISNWPNSVLNLTFLIHTWPGPVLDNLLHKQTF